jgi:hypothetical protein
MGLILSVDGENVLRLLEKENVGQSLCEVHRSMPRAGLQLQHKH